MNIRDADDLDAEKASSMNWHSQDQFEIRFEWGLEGARNLSSQVDVTIVVDVLSFSTCVDLAVSQGATVYPFHFKDSRAAEYADSIGAKLANSTRAKTELCLSPATMKLLAAGDKLVLPSPNGSSISFAIEKSVVLCGSLRNAKSVAEIALMLGSKILVVAAGEKWNSSDTLRPAVEDQLGAGAILSYLTGTKSPEAHAAIAVFKNSEKNFLNTLNESSTGRELIERGYPEDVQLAAELNVSQSVPILRNKAFKNFDQTLDFKEGFSVLRLKGSDAKDIVDPFYKSVKSIHRARDEDTFFVLMKGNRTIGTVRHCYENGVSLLRSMQVHPDFRGKKLGTLLLNDFEAFLLEEKIKTTFCLPYSHLLKFYSQIGFKSIPEETAPEFLRSRLADYRAQFTGKQYAFMKREG